MAHDVFISYSKQDKAIADAVCSSLEGVGIRCWIAPRDPSPGGDWAAEIVQAIDTSKVFVLVFSGECNGAVHVRNELLRAVNDGIPIIPFRVEDEKPTGALALHLEGVHWLDALTPPLEDHLKRLSEFVLKILAEGQIQTPPESPRLPPESHLVPSIRRHFLAMTILISAILIVFVAFKLITRPEADIRKEFRLLRLYVDQLEPEKAKALWESIQQRYPQNDIGNELSRQENRTLAWQLKISEPKEFKRNERE